MRDLNAILRIGWELVALVSRLQAGTLRKAGREKAIWRVLDLCEKVSSEGLEASFFERGGQQCTEDSGKVRFVTLSSRNFISVRTAAEVVETDGRLDFMLSPLGRAVLWFPLQDARLPGVRYWPRRLSPMLGSPPPGCPLRRSRKVSGLANFAKAIAAYP